MALDGILLYLPLTHLLDRLKSSKGLWKSNQEWYEQTWTVASILHLSLKIMPFSSFKHILLFYYPHGLKGREVPSAALCSVYYKWVESSHWPTQCNLERGNITHPSQAASHRSALHCRDNYILVLKGCSPPKGCMLMVRSTLSMMSG